MRKHVRNDRSRATTSSRWELAFWLLAFVTIVFVLTRLALMAVHHDEDPHAPAAASVRGDVYKSRFDAVLDAQSSGESAR